VIHAPRGRLLLRAEAKDHRAMDVAADVPDLRGRKEIVLEMQPE
jgi:hypothetical protein